VGDLARPNGLAEAARRDEASVLAEQAQAGDAQACGRSWRDPTGALAIAMKVLRNRDDAEDAVQDATLKVWRNLHRFEGRACFTTWIHRIVMNASLDILRRRSGRAEGMAADPGRQDCQPKLEPACDQTPERELEIVEMQLLVQAAVARLTPVHRQAIHPARVPRLCLRRDRRSRGLSHWHRDVPLASRPAAGGRRPASRRGFRRRTLGRVEELLHQAAHQVQQRRAAGTRGRGGKVELAQHPAYGPGCRSSGSEIDVGALVLDLDVGVAGIGVDFDLCLARSGLRGRVSAKDFTSKRSPSTCAIQPSRPSAKSF